MIAVRARNHSASLFSQGWFATPQLVLHALWQEVWHSPQPPLTALLAISRVFRVTICFMINSFLKYDYMIAVFVSSVFKTRMRPAPGGGVFA